MTAAFIFVACILSYLLLFASFKLKDYPLGMLSGIAILIIGIYIAIYNVEGISNLLTEAFAVISILLGAYVFINTSMEQIDGLM